MGGGGGIGGGCSRGRGAARGAGVEDGEIGIESARRAGFFTSGVCEEASAEHWDTLKHYADIAATELRQVYYAVKNALKSR